MSQHIASPVITPDGYAGVRAAFDWGDEAFRLTGARVWPDPALRMNIAALAVDRPVAEGHGDRVALRVLGPGTARQLTYSDLQQATARFAGLLAGLGLGRGERVFSLLGREPELYQAALGTLRHGGVFCPLFSAFGPEPIRERLTRGDARVLVTSAELYLRKVEPIRAAVPGLRHVCFVDEVPPGVEGAIDLPVALRQSSPDGAPAATTAEDMALLHFTSGTTGTPKGAVHVHAAGLGHHVTARLALDLHADDVFWCTADPGWVTGTSYGIIAPLTHGATLVSDSAEFDARRWYRTLQDERVTVWYTAPTALRMLMRHGDELPARYDLSALRYVVSVGEPLNAEVVLWAEKALGRPVHDSWWQTETGAILIANYPFMPVRPGSMGRPVPGVEVALVESDPDGEARSADGRPCFVEQAGVVGQIAVRRGWPSMFRGYLHDDERYARCFVGDWYLSGDLAHRDEDGYYWFAGRADDVIKSAGHLIGPFEVEALLMRHPAVLEAGVIGTPDPVAGEVVKAYVTLRPGYEPSDDLSLELIAYARRSLGGLAPRYLVFDPTLPHTRSGKIMRRLLRARDQGLPEGDLSTLEGPAPEAGR